MMWVVSYDVPSTHDKWRYKIARELSNFGLFRIQYSVFMGDISTNSIQACKLRLEGLLKGNNVPSDVRFFPVCSNCEKKILRINTSGYSPMNQRTTPSLVIP